MSKLETSYAELLAERDRLRLELKNFLDAFDMYFDMRGLGNRGSVSKVMDAKQAMFSAANQARGVLGE